MERRSSPFSMTLAFANPDGRVARPVGRPSSVARSAEVARPDTPTTVVIAALSWLLLGCSGLLWIIAFTSDTDSLVLALAVWVLAFVGPSVCATSLAYRLDADAPERDAGERPARQG